MLWRITHSGMPGPLMPRNAGRVTLRASASARVTPGPILFYTTLIV
jgi:hypothetical protein